MNDIPCCPFSLWPSAFSLFIMPKHNKPFRKDQRRPQTQRPTFEIPRATGEVIYGRNAVREALRAKRRTLRGLLVAEGVREGGPVAELIESPEVDEKMPPPEPVNVTFWLPPSDVQNGEPV